MRLVLLFALLLVPPFDAAAQEPAADTLRGRETQTLLGAAVRHGGYGALVRT
jgi:hypothetical protein